MMSLLLGSTHAIPQLTLSHLKLPESLCPTHRTHEREVCPRLSCVDSPQELTFFPSLFFSLRNGSSGLLARPSLFPVCSRLRQTSSTVLHVHWFHFLVTWKRKRTQPKFRLKAKLNACLKCGEIYTILFLTTQWFRNRGISAWSWCNFSCGKKCTDLFKWFYFLCWSSDKVTNCKSKHINFILSLFQLKFTYWEV